MKLRMVLWTQNRASCKRDKTIWYGVWAMRYTREMPADEKSLSPDPDIRAIPVVQSMEGLTLISDWEGGRIK